MNRTLKTVRIAISIIFFLTITAALTAAPLAIPGVASWMERIQFLPAVITFSLSIFIGWLIITLVFGRIYCSTVCPMGTLQDIITHIRQTVRPKDFRYTTPANSLRYITVLIVLITLMAGTLAIPSVLDPYTAYARICKDLLSPIYSIFASDTHHTADAMTWWNNIALRALTGWIGTSIAIITLCTVAAFASRRGRLVCNTVCPVGTTLGLISRFAILQIEIDTDKCTNCRKCEYACKSQCINMADHVVDSSRCVNCFDCLSVCRDNAIHYTSRRKQLSLPMMQQIKPIRRMPETSLDSANPSPCKKTKKNS
jgi:polyferredoxin